MELDLWDISGKLPHLWSHYFTGGVHGIIYVIDNKILREDDSQSTRDEIEAYYKKVQQQILNIIINNFEVPLAILVNCREDFLEIQDVDDNGHKIKSINAQVPRKMLSLIDRDWFDKNI